MTKTGKCFCGAVTFAAEGDPVRMAQCHCEACRRATGTGHNVQAFFERDRVTISGNTKTYAWTADSGSARSWIFCPECGARLFGTNAKAPEIIGIAAGAFDDSSWFKPQFIVYSKNRPVWDIDDPAVEIKS